MQHGEMQLWSDAIGCNNVSLQQLRALCDKVVKQNNHKMSTGEIGGKLCVVFLTISLNNSNCMITVYFIYILSQKSQFTGINKYPSRHSLTMKKTSRKLSIFELTFIQRPNNLNTEVSSKDIQILVAPCGI